MSKDLYEICFSLFQRTNLNSLNKIVQISGSLVVWLKFEYISKVLVLNQRVSLEDDSLMYSSLNDAINMSDCTPITLNGAAIMNIELEKMRNETAIAKFKIFCWYLNRGAEENQGKTQHNRYLDEHVNLGQRTLKH
jgi:hypothetical protein